MEDLSKLRQQGIAVLAGVAWLATLIIMVGGLIRGEGFLAVLLAAALLVYPTLAAIRKVDDAATRIVIGATMPLYCGILLFEWSGHPWQIDLHMAFFAMIAALAIMADWRAILAGAGVTAIHHLALNFAAPALVFGAEPDLGRVILHAVVVIAETGVLVVLTQRLEALLLAQVAARNEKARLEAAANAERAAREADQKLVVSEIESGLRALAAGNLNCPITTRFPAVFEPLRADFNSTIESLNLLVSKVADASDAIRNGANEIRCAADDLARRTEMEAASVEQASHTIGALVASASATATSAAQANDTLSASKERATRGHAVVARAMDTMQRIENSASEISQIISLIDGIAFQTNLLALNAGVEAARAGEAGKGFAVVATEVRALAQRSAEAAKNIASLITASTTQVNDGVELVTQTGDLLKALMADVTSIGTLVTEIADSARGNAQELSGVRDTFHAIGSSTQRNAAMAEESNAALRTLAQETDSLMDVLAHFKDSQDHHDLRRAA